MLWHFLFFGCTPREERKSVCEPHTHQPKVLILFAKCCKNLFFFSFWLVREYHPQQKPMIDEGARP